MKFYLYESKENVDWIMECEGTTMCHIHGVFIPSYEQDFLTDKRPWESKHNFTGTSFCFLD